MLTELTETDATDNASLRNLANAIESMVKSYDGSAAQAAGAAKQAPRQSAKESYQQAVHLLLRLEARNALSQYARKSLEKLQTVLRKYE